MSCVVAGGVARCGRVGRLASNAIRGCLVRKQRLGSWQRRGTRGGRLYPLEHLESEAFRRKQSDLTTATLTQKAA